MTGMTQDEADRVVSELRAAVELHGPPRRAQTGVASDDDQRTFYAFTLWTLADGEQVRVRLSTASSEREADARARALARTIRRSFASAGVEVVTDPSMKPEPSGARVGRPHHRGGRRGRR